MCTSCMYPGWPDVIIGETLIKSAWKISPSEKLCIARISSLLDREIKKKEQTIISTIQEDPRSRLDSSKGLTLPLYLRFRCYP